MKDDIKLSAWERVPNEYKRQLYAFLAFDHYHHIKREYELGGKSALLKDAVDWIGYALDEAESKYDKEGRSAAILWMKENMDRALECHCVEFRQITEGDTTYPDIAHGFNDNRGEVVFKWKGTNMSGLQDAQPLDEKLKGGKAPEKRWQPWINWMGAIYFFQNVPTSTSGVPGLYFQYMRFDELLVTAMPEEDKDEVAALFAAKLTAPGAEGREVYRPDKPSAEKKDGTFYPEPLVKDVGKLISVDSRETIRGRMRRGGYQHPENLLGTKRPIAERPKRRPKKQD